MEHRSELTKINQHTRRDWNKIQSSIKCSKQCSTRQASKNRYEGKAQFVGKTGGEVHLKDDIRGEARLQGDTEIEASQTSQNIKNKIGN